MPPDSKPSTPAKARALNLQLLALREAVLAISSDLSLADTLRRIVASAAQLAGARYAALGVPDETGETLIEFITTGLTTEEEAQIPHRPRGRGILGVLLRDGASLRLQDLRRHPRSYGFPPNHPPMKSFLGVPIVHKGRLLGNLYLTDKVEADEFSGDDQRLIEFLAAHAGIAIENARLHERVQQLAVIEERQRIGMDLHDGVIQSIYGVGLMLEYLKGQLADGDVTSATRRLDQSIQALNHTIRDIRAYILDLRPRRFQGDNLAEGLRDLIRMFKANSLMMVEAELEEAADAALTPDARLALFHVAQEALSNAAKHSGASAVEVRLVSRNNQIVMSLTDNGRGLNTNLVERRVGHGLMNMQDRARAIGGDFSISASEAGGTTVQVVLPRRAPAL